MPAATQPPTAPGSRYHSLTAIRFDHKKGRNPYWLFKCDCGVEKVQSLGSVRSGAIKGCGCILRQRLRTHGLTKSREYRSWMAMRRRCRDEKHSSFDRYGGAGVTICDRWYDSFEDFLADVGRAPSEKHTLDRIKNELGYEVGNVRWATPKEQQRNRRYKKTIILNGAPANFAEACEKAGLDYRMVAGRIRSGWTPEEALADTSHATGRYSRDQFRVTRR